MGIDLINELLCNSGRGAACLRGIFKPLRIENKKTLLFTLNHSLQLL